MTRSRAGTGRIPNRVMAEYYAQRRAAGLLITEATTISEEANGWPLAELAPMSDWYSPTGQKGYTDFPASAPQTAGR